MKKRVGEVEIIVSVFFILFLVTMLAACMQMAQIRSTKLYVEDALAASNLASAVIDIEEYGRTNQLVIADPEAAYLTYQQALKINLSLNDSWECLHKALLSGPVKILNYTIYNVKGRNVEIHRFENGNLHSSMVTDGLGSVKAPDGTSIESTSVYSLIGFSVDGILGMHVEAQKGKLADIVTQGG